MPKMVISRLAFLIAFMTPIAAAEVCSLEVRVVNEDGTLIDDALVELRTADGKVVNSARTERGRVRFCDFGFGAHFVRVGGDPCHPVTVEGVRAHFDWENTITMTEAG